MSQVSRAAQEFRRRIEDEARFLETCEGGDPGTPDRPSIWVLGIEPGWSLADSVAAEKEDAKRDDQLEQYSIDLQLKWPYNRNAFKLLAALNGIPIEDYLKFAKRARPFERGSSGYFKANLFPEPFNKVGSWDAEATKSTGFPTKQEYQEWQRKVRFAVMRSWIKKCRPKLVIGTGLTHLDDFLNITETKETPPTHRFQVNGHSKRLHVANSGVVPVAVVPHLSGGSHGLNSDEATRIAAKIISTAMKY
ncbi:hypothetical protein D8I30_02870 [Brevundimonas naejangsanensis]|uniref:Uracil-DNA glycosylase-like domain-containing protein n=1 Tax=Brevundimonas naejangsanensis TaxID=588932 RepID=A0A494RK40_9CAUL|nr:hypothetical protein [Brevundimonas naejangsanensis]AYG94244.1 hypothetical protein D8I30_02870 [Brevundimonas naejangsanensis]